MTECTTTPQKFCAIDLTAALDAIRSKYGDRYFAMPEAMREAAALWGVTPETQSINDHGVFTAIDSFTVRHRRCSAEINLVKAPNGYWAMGTSYMLHLSGAGYAPSVRRAPAFPNRDEARLAALRELIGRLQAVVESNCVTNREENRDDIRHLIALLEAEKTPQLSLF